MIKKDWRQMLWLSTTIYYQVIASAQLFRDILMLIELWQRKTVLEAIILDR